jgi:basic membrane lipoprotein Med (substrate-binding protein (PBP1-ABC) superfamily)
MKKFKVLLMLALLPLFAVTLAGCVDSDSSSDYDSEQTTTDNDDYGTSNDDDESDDYSNNDSDYDMDEEVDKAAKAYYGEGTEEYNQYSEWHEDHPVGNSFN